MGGSGGGSTSGTYTEFASSYVGGLQLALTRGGLGPDAVTPGPFPEVWPSYQMFHYLKASLDAPNPFSSNLPHNPSVEISQILAALANTDGLVAPVQTQLDAVLVKLDEIYTYLNNITLDVGIDDDIFAYLSTIDQRICTVIAAIDHLQHKSNWAEVMEYAKNFIDEAIISEPYIQGSVEAFSTSAQYQLDTEIFPAYETGARDLNSIMSSTYVLGKGLIYQRKLNLVTDYEKQLRLQLHTERNGMIMQSTQQMLSDLMRRIDFMVQTTQVMVSNANIKGVAQQVHDDINRLKIALGQSLSAMGDQYLDTARLQGTISELYTNLERLAIEGARMSYVMESEYAADKAANAESAGRYPMEIYQYAFNAIASITGGVVQTMKQQHNKTASAVGGALSGAAAGAMIGAKAGSAYPGYGTAIGAGVGAIAGAIGGYNQ